MTVSTGSHTSPSPATTEQGQSQKPRMIRVCHGEAVDRPPVWLMRQAGRYMAEYQAMRSKYSFLEMCKTVDAAVEVSLQPMHAFGMDGCILFSDILTAGEAMGMALEFHEGKGPIFLNPIETEADIDRLVVPDPTEAMGFVAEALKQLRPEIQTHWPDSTLLGFAGAPWTVASYMVEGGSSKHFLRLKKLMVENPRAFHKLLQKVTDTTVPYLNMQIAAGAQVVQLFDSWAGVVSQAQYAEFIAPYHRQIIERLDRNAGPDPWEAPMVLYVQGSRGLIPQMDAVAPDVVSVDWMTSLTEARQLVAPHRILQGNLDPAILFAQKDVVIAETQKVLAAGGDQRYIFNLGHGVLPKTPVENVKALVDTVKNHRNPVS